MGVARQYCGRLGKVASCQAGMFPGPMSARWAGPWWTSGCICRRVWTSDKDRCEAAGVPEGEAGLPVEDGTGVGDAGAGLGAGPSGGWPGLPGDDAFGMSAVLLPGGTSGSGDVVRAGRSRRQHRLALGAGLDQCGLSGVPGVPESPSWWTDSGGPSSSAAKNCRGDAWREDKRWRRDPRGRGAICSAPSGCG